MDQTLIVIPARGGSKGVPGKNIKPLRGKSLIYYTIDAAREIVADEHICVSTDSEEIKETVENYGLRVPFLRPSSLAQDNSGSYEVLLHATAHYSHKQVNYKSLILLQPTSPFRTGKHIKEALALYKADPDIQMVVSVKEAKDNPYYNIVEENESGFLHKSKPSHYTTRQQCPPTYVYNGAIYVMNIAALQKMHYSRFSKIKKYLMSEEASTDIDTPFDWEFCEFLLQKKHEHVS